MDTPKAVLAAAAGLVRIYGPRFQYMGERNGAQYFMFRFPENEKTGFPFVYQYVKGEPVLEISGFDALDLIASFVE
jgi:hypothetical protein